MNNWIIPKDKMSLYEVLQKYGFAVDPLEQVGISGKLLYIYIYQYVLLPLKLLEDLC